jgi:acyl carrier protein
MKDADIWNGLREIFEDVFSRDDIVLTPGLTAKHVDGWDSFRQIEIIIAAQQRFAVKFRSAEIDKLTCLGDLFMLIRAKVAPGERATGR